MGDIRGTGYKEPEQWFMFNQKQEICSHKKRMQHHVGENGFDVLLLACDKCKIVWSLDGDE